MNLYENKHINANAPGSIRLFAEYSADSCCGYLKPHLKPNYSILDVGCGPGNITVGLAKLCPFGSTVGVDLSQDVVQLARDGYCNDTVPNLRFEVGDAALLSQFPDASFDVVHAHACLMHFTDKVRVLKTFRRICKPGGIVAIRDTRSMGVILSLKPDLPDIRDQFWAAREILLRLESNTDSNLNAKWAAEAGLDEDGGLIIIRRSENRFRTPMSFPPEMTAGTVYFTEEQVARWQKAWDIWASTENHELVCPASEMLCFLGKKHSNLKLVVAS